MELHNLRFGLATNSSSSHSIVFLENPKSVETDLDAEKGEFGWNFFTAASKASKARYVAATLAAQIVPFLNDEAATALVQKWIAEYTGISLPDDFGYVDHQSSINFPMERPPIFDSGKHSKADKTFLREFLQFILKDDVAILGGNDNDEASHPLLAKSKAIWECPLKMDTYREICYARKDHKYDYWTIFNTKDGTKIRFSFEEGAIKPEKSFGPELVDVKITSRCPFVNEPCYEYCYQGSEPQSPHAKRDDVASLARNLADIGVFEVALGGGEPTFHPNFVEILERFSERGIVPNFTTRSKHWLRDDAQRKEIIEKCGAFAVSVNSDKDLREFLALRELYKLGDKMTAQVVVGSVNQWALEQILRLASVHQMTVTLLGYKETGRGGRFRPRQDNKQWLEIAKELKDSRALPRLSIDTVLAKECEKELISSGIPSYWFHTEEGMFSMYIDMVEKRMASSSFANEDEYVPYEDDSTSIISAYQNW